MVGPHRVLSKALAWPPGGDPASSANSAGRTNIDVAKVGCEMRKKSLHVFAGAIPCDHPVHCGCVANIVQPRRSMLADRATNSGGSADMLKPRDDPRIVPRSTIARGE